MARVHNGWHQEGETASMLVSISPTGDRRHILGASGRDRQYFTRRIVQYQPARGRHTNHLTGRLSGFPLGIPFVCACVCVCVLPMYGYRSSRGACLRVQFEHDHSIHLVYLRASRRVCAELSLSLPSTTPLLHFAPQPLSQTLLPVWDCTSTDSIPPFILV